MIPKSNVRVRLILWNMDTSKSYLIDKATYYPCCFTANSIQGKTFDDIISMGQYKKDVTPLR